MLSIANVFAILPAVVWLYSEIIGIQTCDVIPKQNFQNDKHLWMVFDGLCSDCALIFWSECV